MWNFYITKSCIATKIKHRVQNPRRVTKPEPIASTHSQMGPRIAHLLVGISTVSMDHRISDKNIACVSSRACHVKHHAS